MANSLKIKIGITVFSIFVIALVPLLQNKFFAPVTIKRWSTVSWNDFQGIPRPFSSYDASIGTAIYLDFDPITKRYFAYAGQNNIYSWVKNSDGDEGYLLNHEQYHFNITELHARRLNEYIADNPDATLNSIMLRLGSINIDLSTMQDQYDWETNHSTTIDKQRSWEYKIDSLLMLEKGWLTDNYSGAHVYLPNATDSSKGVINGVAYRFYGQYTYGMQLSLTSYQQSNVNLRKFGENVKYNIEKRAERLKRLSFDTVENFRIFAISEDTSNNTFYQMWLANDSYLYQLKTCHPNHTKDTTGYTQIANSFFNSFKVVNTENYWFGRGEALKSPIIVSTVSKINERGKNESRQECIQINRPGVHGFYKGPFFREDGSMFIAYDNVTHPDSLHHEDVLMIGKDLYRQSPIEGGQIFFVPRDRIPVGKFNLKFGYTLLEDSTRRCYRFYFKSIEVSPEDELANAVDREIL